MLSDKVSPLAKQLAHFKTLWVCLFYFLGTTLWHHYLKEPIFAFHLSDYRTRARRRCWFKLHLKSNFFFYLSVCLHRQLKHCIVWCKHNLMYTKKSVRLCLKSCTPLAELLHLSFFFFTRHKNEATSDDSVDKTKKNLSLRKSLYAYSNID